MLAEPAAEDFCDSLQGREKTGARCKLGPLPCGRSPEGRVGEGRFLWRQHSCDCPAGRVHHAQDCHGLGRFANTGALVHVLKMLLG